MFSMFSDLAENVYTYSSPQNIQHIKRRKSYFLRWVYGGRFVFSNPKIDGSYNSNSFLFQLKNNKTITIWIIQCYLSQNLKKSDWDSHTYDVSAIYFRTLGTLFYMSQKLLDDSRKRSNFCTNHFLLCFTLKFPILKNWCSLFDDKNLFRL